MEKVIVLLGKHGDIASVANYYLKAHKHKGYKPVWVVSGRFRSILDDLFPNEFDIFSVDIPTNNPQKAAHLARFRYPFADVQICQQNGYDIKFDGIRLCGNYEAFQRAQLDLLFSK
jgi:hypothetical protein